MAEDILAEAEKAELSAQKQVAAQFYYMQKVGKDINEIRQMIRAIRSKPEKIESMRFFEKSERTVRDAERAYRYVGRGEYKAYRSEEEALKDFQEIERQIPEELKRKLGMEAIDTSLQTEIGRIERITSMYTGSLRKSLKKLEKALRRGEAELAAAKGKPDKYMAVLKEVLKNIEDLVKSDVSKIEMILKWLGAIVTTGISAITAERAIENWARSA